jgi:hypothetical protein
LRRDARWLNTAQLAAIDDLSLVSLRAPGGKRIDAPAAPLKAITAAVVGVIASLAVFFIAHIAYLSSTTGWFGSKIDFAALFLLVLALLALLRYKLGVMPVIAGCALAGLGWRHLS